MAFLRDLEAGRPLFERARARASEAGDHLQLAWALAFLGYTLLPDPTAARPLVEESLALFRTLAYQSGVAQALNILGEIARFNGDDDQARSAYEDCLAVCQQTGERRRIVFMCSNLAFLAAHTGDFARAKLLGCQGLRLAREMDSDLHMATTLATVAGALGMLGHGRRAIRLFGASESALERMGAFHQLNDRPEVDVVITAVRAQLDEATVQAALEEGRMVTLQQAVAEALDDSDATA
jgi:tetratricopeptide (TPR) repeat protein